MERSDTHHDAAQWLMGIASLHPSYGSGEERYRPSHFGGRFSENAFGPSM